jgi:hypothetical protein
MGVFALISHVMTLIIRVMAGKSNESAKRKNKSRQTDPIRAAIDYGIDVSMLADNLRRSVTDRIKRHQIALNAAAKLRKAKRP